MWWVCKTSCNLCLQCDHLLQTLLWSQWVTWRWPVPWPCVISGGQHFFFFFSSCLVKWTMVHVPRSMSGQYWQFVSISVVHGPWPAEGGPWSAAHASLMDIGHKHVVYIRTRCRKRGPGPASNGLAAADAGTRSTNWACSRRQRFLGTTASPSEEKGVHLIPKRKSGHSNDSWWVPFYRVGGAVVYIYIYICMYIYIYLYVCVCDIHKH